MTDWSNIADHGENLSFDQAAGNVAVVRRTTADAQSLTYNLPGSVKFQANVYYQGSVTGQFSADASPDGATWTPIKIVNAPPSDIGGNWSVSVVSADGPLPSHTNFVRFNLSGQSAAFSPEVGAIRITYGATERRAHRIEESLK